jgi:hypothetical protein
MPAVIASFACGLIFGAGLLISGMTEPEKVLGFLDIVLPAVPVGYAQQRILFVRAQFC